MSGALKAGGGGLLPPPCLQGIKASPSTCQWLILVLGQYVENLKPLNFRSGTFYNKVYEMKYLQNTNMYFFHFNILLF